MTRIALPPQSAAGRLDLSGSPALDGEIDRVTIALQDPGREGPIRRRAA